MDPDPAIFIIDLQDANKKQVLNESFSAYYKTVEIKVFPPIFA
jgi:hypothetical protein